MIPLQLLQDDISPFFGSFTICPFFQSSGTCSCSHTLFKSGYNISGDVWVSALSASRGIPSGPAALPVLRDLMALEISILDGGLVFMPRCSVGGGIVGGVWGARLFNVSLKCSAHRALWSPSLESRFPFLSLTGWLGLLFFLESVLVMSYSFFIFLCPAAVSASFVSSLMCLLLSFLALLFTNVFRVQYCACSSGGAVALR